MDRPVEWARFDSLAVVPVTAMMGSWARFDSLAVVPLIAMVDDWARLGSSAIVQSLAIAVAVELARVDPLLVALAGMAAVRSRMESAVPSKDCLQEELHTEEVASAFEVW